VIKKIFSFFSILLLIVSFPFFIKYLIQNKKIKVLNRIYFNYPGIINKKKDCPNYDYLLENYLDNTFSVTIIDEKGSLITTYNSNKLMVPASNQKLFSSAYVLSKFKLNRHLKTSLFKSRNNYYLIGQGDPDLNYSDIYKLLSYIKENKNINFNILEIDSKLFWPYGWKSSDKLYKYGAPITTLALESNNNKYDDIYTLKEVIDKYLKDKYPSSKINLKISNLREIFYIRNAKEIKKVKSNPIISLLTLANSESHNFTAESLYKNASNSWNTNDYYKLKDWIKQKGLPIEKTNFVDASGLSRENKTTTNLIALFLDKMKYSKNFKTYQSTLSIIGVRGTLSNKLTNSELAGKFFGKTGTLSNVFALSGYLYKNKEPIIISIIQNSDQIDKSKTFKLLKDIYELKSCK